MDASLLISLLVLALGAAFLYFVGAVIIQALRLSILQVRSEMRMKMERHEQEMEHQRLYLHSKKLQLRESTAQLEGRKKAPRTETVELSFEGNAEGLKDILESVEWVRKFAILKNSILLDIEKGRDLTELIDEIEKKSKLRISHVDFAKHT